MDEDVVRIMFFLFGSFYLFQIVFEVFCHKDVYKYLYNMEEDTNNGIKDNDEVKDKPDISDKVPLVYQDKYLMKVRKEKEKEKTSLNQESLSHLRLTFVMEYTPVGNVLMYYNCTRECFEYYSDSTIPYRYLEVVARKYVLMNNCVSIYFDMEEELKRCHNESFNKDDKSSSNSNNDKRLVEKGLVKERLLEERLLEEKDSKKSVFAKFKSYNKEGGSGHVTTAPPPKNNISQVNVKTNNSENVVLKERANRYSHQGKILNFNMLQKMDRTKVDRKFATTYADFKRLKNMERIYDKEDKESEDKESEDNGTEDKEKE